MELHASHETLNSLKLEVTLGLVELRLRSSKCTILSHLELVDLVMQLADVHFCVLEPFLTIIGNFF